MTIADTITRAQARRFYDRLGSRHDLAEVYEGRAKARALELLELQPGQLVLNIGVGTGKEHLQIQRMLWPRGVTVGIDLSPVMLRLAH